MAAMPAYYSNITTTLVYRLTARAILLLIVAVRNVKHVDWIRQVLLTPLLSNTSGGGSPAGDVSSQCLAAQLRTDLGRQAQCVGHFRSGSDGAPDGERPSVPVHGQVIIV